MSWPTAFSQLPSRVHRFGKEAAECAVVLGGLDYGAIEARVLARSVEGRVQMLRPDQRAYYDHLMRSWRADKYRWRGPDLRRRALRKTMENRP